MKDKSTFLLYKGGCKYIVARKSIIPVVDQKLKSFFREQLFRELSNLFKWEGLPPSIPIDYLERQLIRHGTLIFYKDEDIGFDVLQATVTGYNRHNMPIQARTYSPNIAGEKTTIHRRIKRLSDGDSAIENFEEYKDCVLISNMELGKSCGEIVDFYAERMARIQQAFDTNILWSNVPYIFQTSSDETKLSIEKMFFDIFSGKPFVLVDKSLLQDNKDKTGAPTGITFLGKDLMDLLNEVKMKFKEAVGFETSGVDKAERVNTLEVKSNSQHTSTVLDIMLSQRKIACDNINAFYNLSVTVDIIKTEIAPTGGQGEEDGTSDNDLEESTGAGEL